VYIEVCVCLYSAVFSVTLIGYVCTISDRMGQSLTLVSVKLLTYLQHVVFCYLMLISVLDAQLNTMLYNFKLICG